MSTCLFSCHPRATLCESRDCFVNRNTGWKWLAQFSTENVVSVVPSLTHLDEWESRRNQTTNLAKLMSCFSGKKWRFFTKSSRKSDCSGRMEALRMAPWTCDSRSCWDLSKRINPKNTLGKRIDWGTVFFWHRIHPPKLWEASWKHFFAAHGESSLHFACSSNG